MRRRELNINAHNIHQATHFPFPDYESRLRDEVLYLHSLWHRGPPSHHTHTPPFLRPTHSTHFKRTPSSDKEWPVLSKPPSPSPTGSSWPQFNPVSKPVSRPATTQERLKLLGLKIHLKALELCSGLVNDEDDDDDDDDGVCDDAKEYDYLMNVFEENAELREYYDNNKESGDGEYYCLVCGVLGKQLKKKYKNCVPLVQHCLTVLNTKNKAAHRALAHVICKLLAWDLNRLPSFPLNQIEGKNNADGHAPDENSALKTDEGLQTQVAQNSENVEPEKHIPCEFSGEPAEPLDCRSSSTGDAAKEGSEGEHKELNQDQVYSL